GSTGEVVECGPVLLGRRQQTLTEILRTSLRRTKAGHEALVTKVEVDGDGSVGHPPTFLSLHNRAPQQGVRVLGLPVRFLGRGDRCASVAPRRRRHVPASLGGGVGGLAELAATPRALVSLILEQCQCPRAFVVIPFDLAASYGAHEPTLAVVVELGDLGRLPSGESFRAHTPRACRLYLSPESRRI